jgi:anti-anti-sigma regulatory factor
MVTMTTVALQNVDEESVVKTVREAKQALNGTGSNTVLDFSLVCVVRARTLGAMEELAQTADEKDIKIVLRGVRPGVYKALKLARLTRKFGFEG